MALNNVENTKLSTWAGSPNLTTCNKGSFGTAAVKTAGSASGNVPVNGSSLGTTNGNIVTTNASGQLQPSGKVIGTSSGNVPSLGGNLPSDSGNILTSDGSGHIISSGKKIGTSSGNVPTLGANMGTTNNNILVSDASGHIKPSGTTIGSAAGKTAGSASGNVPINASALGTTNNNILVTNASGQVKASGTVLGSAAGYPASSTYSINSLPTYDGMSKFLTACYVETGFSLSGSTLTITVNNPNLQSEFELMESVRLYFPDSYESASEITEVKLKINNSNTFTVFDMTGKRLRSTKLTTYAGSLYKSSKPYMLFKSEVIFDLMYVEDGWLIYNSPYLIYDSIATGIFSVKSNGEKKFSGHSTNSTSGGYTLHFPFEFSSATSYAAIVQDNNFFDSDRYLSATSKTKSTVIVNRVSSASSSWDFLMLGE